MGNSNANFIRARVAPFVAKFGTRLQFDMDMFESLTDVQLIYAISSKVNELVCFDNDTREIVEEFSQLVIEMRDEWNNVKDTFEPQIRDAVNEYFESSTFTDLLSQKVNTAVEGLELNERVSNLEDAKNATDTAIGALQSMTGSLNYDQRPINSPIMEFDFRTQSMCCEDGQNPAIYITEYTAEDNVIIHKVVNGSITQSSGTLALGHANGMAYYNGSIYVATFTSVVVVSASTLQITSTINISAFAISYYDGNFYTLESGTGLCVYDTAFANRQVIGYVYKQSDHVTEQGLCVNANGIYIGQTSITGEGGNLLTHVSHTGEHLGYSVISVNSEIEQVCYAPGDDVFYACQNIVSGCAISMVAIDRLYGTFAEALYAGQFSANTDTDGVTLYVNPSATGNYADGTEEHPFRHVAMLCAITLPDTFTVEVMANSTEDLSLYNFSNITIEAYGNSTSITLPRVTNYGTIRYNYGIYDKAAFYNIGCNIIFSNTRIKLPSGANLFEALYGTSLVLMGCTFDYTDGAWQLCDSLTQWRSCIISGLKCIGDGTTTYTLGGTTGPGCGQRVTCLDTRSTKIFPNAECWAYPTGDSDGADDVFAIGVNCCGYTSGAGRSFFNVAGCTPNRCIQFSQNTDYSLQWRAVSGRQYVQIDGQGNITYPQKSLGEWNNV